MLFCKRMPSFIARLVLCTLAAVAAFAPYSVAAACSVGKPRKARVSRALPPQQRSTPLSSACLCRRTRALPRATAQPSLFANCCGALVFAGAPWRQLLARVYHQPADPAGAPRACHQSSRQLERGRARSAARQPRLTRFLSSGGADASRRRLPPMRSLRRPQLRLPTLPLPSAPIPSRRC